MAEDPRTPHYVELWKQTIAVQQHFNDISWRIRGLALTVMTFALGTAAVTAREDIEVGFFGLSLEFASLVLWLGLVLWLAFYFVDKSWYHRLLIGAVKHGQDLEKELHRDLPDAGLTHAISTSSPGPVPRWVRWVQGTARFERSVSRLPSCVQVGLRKQSIHSTGKLRCFYWIGAGVLILLALGLQFGS